MGMMLYLFIVADNFKTIVECSFVLLFIGLIIFLIKFYMSSYGDVDYDDLKTPEKKALFKKIVTWIVALSIVSMLIPSKKDIAMIYVIPKVLESKSLKSIQEEMPGLTKLGLQALQEQLEQTVTKEKK